MHAICEECGKCPKQTISKKEFRPNRRFPGYFEVWYFVAETAKWELRGSDKLEVLQDIYGNQPIVEK